MDKYDDELTRFMAQTPSVWKKKFRARAYTTGGMRTDGFIRDICFLVKQHRFTKTQNIGWVKLVRDIIGELNEGAEASRLISIGVLELLNKSENDIVYREDSDLLQDFIDQLIGCNI